MSNNDSSINTNITSFAANLNDLPDALLRNLNELLNRSTLGPSEPPTATQAGRRTQQPKSHGSIGAMLPTDLLTGVGLSNVRIANIAINSTSQAERLLQYIQVLKLKQIHNNVDGRLNMTQLQRDFFTHLHTQNINSIEVLMELLGVIVHDCENYQANSVLDYIELDD